MSNLLSAVQKLLVDYQEFEDMDNGRKAAFRARITRYLNRVTDEDIREVLEQLQDEVGAAAPRTTAKLTVEDCEKEFLDSFSGYENNRRGAFKAKVSRLLRAAEKGGDSQAVKRLQSLQIRVAGLEKDEAKAAIMNLASKGGLTD